MSPKEKALELVDKFRIHQPVWEVESDAKQCALIAVDEIMETPKTMYGNEYHLLMDVTKYWQEVKHEIEKL